MKFYITTPIYYANDVPHIGHSYTTIASDVIARWKRLNNFDVFFLTGTDEHGAKIAAAAREKNKTPQDLCNEMSAKFKEAWKLLNISYTEFIRTTEQNHLISVKEIVEILFKTGFIFKKKYEGLYCLECEKFYSQKDLDESGSCLLHKTRSIVQSEENYFFRLSSFQFELLKRISNPNHKEYIEIQPEERKNEIIGKLRLGLEDISFSRIAVEWGIPLPFDKKQTVYVWVDALINYITGVGYITDDAKFQKYWPVDVHLMAKDILWFHSVVWPAILMAVKLPLPKKIFSHGFFTLNGNKMSKSLGNVISPRELVDKYGIDAARYLMVTFIPFGPDGDISWRELTSKYNADLANNLGNLISRTIKMVEKYFNFQVSRITVNLQLARKVAVVLRKSFAESMDDMQFHKAAEVLKGVITLINRQIEIDAPWKLFKVDTKKLSSCVSSYLQAICIIAIYLLPFMPTSSERIWNMMGGIGNINETAKKYFADMIIPEDGFSAQQTKSNMMEILFPRIEK
ncbi:MAG: methionine--tRNA ligase [Endomicrobium sp.]|jgi:methionyl-tRNA synthetase|nr:methionine--tRNA ligase [Endomicrobium sp.]